MIQTKSSKALRSTVLSQNDSNKQKAHAQAQVEGANHDLTGCYNDAPALDGAPFEQRDFVPFRTGDRISRQDRVDDESSSRAKMWDPVKDCSDPDTVQEDVPSFQSARCSSREQLMDSLVSGSTSIGLQFSGSHPYEQAQDSPQQMDSTSLSPQHHPYDMTSGDQGSASIGLPSYPLSHARASGYQGGTAMGSQLFQTGHPHDQSQRSRQHRAGYENISYLPPYLKDPSAQRERQSLESITRGAALMGIQPCQPANSNGYFQENGPQFNSTQSKMPASVISHESAPQQSRPLISSHILTQRKPDSQQANRAQHRMISADISKAISMAQHAESLDHRSNRTEAVRAYEQACTLFQEAIIRSSVFEERMQCNDARNACQARLDVLLRESAAGPSNGLPGQSDQQDDDGPGGGKPQYSLFEDWTLCRRAEEDLSWQEVAETSLFKGKRKHRSLSQRKHTIGRMGPKYHEAERPWTEDEDRKLCALGDARKTLGDIHRKFRSRNAERCMNRYYYLKGYYHAPDRSVSHTSHEARLSPTPNPLSTQHTLHPSIVARHPAYRVHEDTSVVEPASYRQCRGTPPQPSYQASTTLNHSDPSLSLSHLDAGGHQDPTASVSAQTMDNALGATSGDTFGNPASPEAIGNESTDWPFTSERQKLTTSTSSSVSPANSPFGSTSTMPTPSSSASISSLLEKHDSPDSHRAAAKRARKSRRATYLEKL